ncbi:complement C1q tumor necrosis factor-related protein 4-like [Argopecten irradians]|uniref:complement C1q tumor necrosis factor-related protein 4-like n=1 Tax=Argopecten irradians TaxID=31199 RepID=UPI0037112600
MAFLCGLVALCLSMLGADGQGTSVTPVAAFTKGLTSHLHLVQGENLNFDKIITNVNAHIDANGVFQATKQGMYAFHFYSLTRQNTELWIELYKNTELICSAYAHNPSQGGYADAGNSALLYLTPGDTVYVKAHDAYDNTFYGEEDQIYTTFTGVLLDSGFFEHEGFDKTAPHGFSVGLTSNLTIADGGKVAYDKDFNNNAAMAGYNMTSHDFIAPVEGLYIFHLHALSLADKEVYIELFQNKQYVLSAYAYTTNEWGDAANSVILHLNQNDDVTIKARPQYDVQLFGDPTQVYCTFSGALLSMTVPGNNVGGGSLSEVAFSVGLSHNVNISAYSKVPWDRLFINYGNRFDMRTGTFTAEVDGIYVFLFHGLSQTGQEFYVELYHNFQYIDSAYAYDANSYAAGSNAASLKLMAGDQVYVGVQSQTILYGGYDEIYCTFSGYLLAPLAQSQPIVG